MVSVYPTRMKAHVLALLAGVLLCGGRTPVAGAQLHAGQLGDLAGRVRDESGAVVSGAVVTLKRGDGFEREAVTNSDGEFRFVRAPLGDAVVEVTLPGFRRVRQRVRIGLGQTASVDIVLPVSQLTEVTSVSDVVRPPPSAPPDVPVRWNAWTEHQPGDSHAPTKVVAGGTYTLLVHLAALDYSTEGPAIFGRAVSNHLSRRLLDLLDERPNDRSVSLTALLVTDQRALEVLDPPQELIISLARLRRLRDSGVPAVPNPLAALGVNPDPDFLFGKVRFRIRAKSGFTGKTMLGLSIWDGMRPIDEVAFGFCVGASEDARTCRRSPAIVQNLKGIDSARLAAADRDDQAPDAALHIVDLGAHATGVLRLREWPEGRYVTWSMEADARKIANRVDTLGQQLFTASSTTFRRTGEALYDLLLPRTAAKDAREALESLVNTARAAGPFASANPPALFVRSVGSGSAFAPIIPAGAFWLRALDTYLGYHVRTEAPLPIQDYDRNRECLTSWVVLAPELVDDSELGTALNEVREHLQTWRLAGAKVLPTVDEFGDWVASPTAEERTVLAVLSHQEDGRLRARDQIVQAENIARPLPGSVAFLSACNSVAGPAWLVERLNRNGVVTVIATTAKVEPVLGGRMFAAMASPLGTASTTPQPAWRVFWQAQRTVFEHLAVRTSPIPESVLIYQLLGNGSLQLCRPPTPPVP
jgi:hypothetical protein